MSWLRLFFLPKGRISRRHFWLAVLSLQALTLVLGGLAMLAPPLPSILLHAWVLILLLFPKACVFGKRLHDIGWPAWPALVVLIASAVVDFLSTMVNREASARADSIDATLTQSFEISREASAAFTSNKLVAFTYLAALALLLVAGIAKGNAGPNRFGDPPRAKPDAIASDDMSAH